MEWFEFIGEEEECERERESNIGKEKKRGRVRLIDWVVKSEHVTGWNSLPGSICILRSRGI